MPTIDKLFGREILDSRGMPTVLATCVLKGGMCGSASVPSGASRGTAEAFELRDRDASRYRGLGCRRAADNINSALCRELAGQEMDQSQLDAVMVAIDGTPNKSRLGANAILSVSIAFARACARQQRVPLYQYFASMSGLQIRTLPRLTINLFSGGKHAGQQVSIQDVLIIPMSANTVDEALATASDVYYAAAELIDARYGMRLLTADEGGLAPPFRNVDEMFALALESIERAGYRPGEDFHLAVDVASSHFYCDGRYHIDSESLDSDRMMAKISDWLMRYPILSVEDGLAEEDWEHWPRLRTLIGGHALTLGDDLLCTNAGRIQRAIETGACDALLLKVNQVGTLSEALASCRLARTAGWSVTLSVRSGETEDNWAADLAVGWQADQFKNGSIRQSERLAKYNRLLEIAEETHSLFSEWPRSASHSKLSTSSRWSSRAGCETSTT